MRSGSTTPRSLRGTKPDDYDRVMGVSQVGPHETARFGEGNATDIDDQDRVVNKWKKSEKELTLMLPHIRHLRMILALAEFCGDTVGPHC